MNVVETPLAGVRILEPRVFGDERGFFLEAWNVRAFAAAGIDANFVQDNHSRSARGVLRGLHYQIRQPQGKLVRCIAGAIHDVVVDLRRASPTFGQWFAVDLDAESKRMIWVPPGFAHGFVVTSDSADVIYKVTDFWAPEHERTLAWDAPELAIPWPMDRPPVLSAKDARGATLATAEVFD